MVVDPSAINGVPIPIPRAKSAKPPTRTSPVLAIYISAPINGAVTQGPTISADSTPIIATSFKPPDFCLLLAFVSKVWIDFGIWMLKNLNIASAKRKNSNDIDPITYGLWRLACIFVPDVATIIPANAYLKN